MGKHKASTFDARSLAITLVASMVAALFVLIPRVSDEPAFASSDPGSLSEVDYAGYFNGTTSYVDKGDNSVVIPNDSSITVEAWVWPEDGGVGDRYKALINQNQDGPGSPKNDRFGLWLYRNDAGTGYQVHLSSDLEVWVITDTSIPFEAWSHLAVVLDGASWKIFIDGQLAKSGVAASPPQFSANAANFHIGSTGETGDLSEIPVVVQAQKRNSVVLSSTS